MYELASSWSKICDGLYLSDSTIAAIKEKHDGDNLECLRKGLQHWLQGKHAGDPPTWKQLVIAVDCTYEERSHELARRIAEKHKGNT